MNSQETKLTPLIINLFGPAQVVVDGRPFPHLRSRKGLWLLALLSLRHDRPVNRDWLAGTLWPDIDQAQAFANLRPILSDLRSALGSQKERLKSPDRHTLLLDLTGAAVDALAFDTAIRSGKPAELERAVGLYKGPLLEGCTEEWVFQERSAREMSCLEALQKLADGALATGDNDSAIRYFQRASALDPWLDSTRRGQMEALARSGDRNSALQVYRAFVEALRDDPTATPDEQTTALYVRLRAEARTQDRSHAVVAATPATPLTAPKVTGYLPHAMTDLIGREDECLEVSARLRRSRLVTLTGLGGIGKTRLALEVARMTVKEHADGVWLVALDSLTESRQVMPQISSVLGVKEEHGSSLLDSVKQHLGAKRLLLVLDNCEHVLDESAKVAGELLRDCGGLRILATSREALDITGEAAWNVPSLATPEPEHLPQGQATLLRVMTGYESVQLFVERAQSVRKGFALTSDNARLVAQICHKLEGIPLAIELAAARVKAMSVDQIAARLDNELKLLIGGSRIAQPRQQTLRAMLDWSHALLIESEQRLLERLSVFAEGWSLEAAEHVCSSSESEQGQMLDLLTSMTDKSLVTFEERNAGGRYRLLEMVRQYGSEKLDASGDASQVKARHRDYFLALAEEAEPRLAGADQGEWLERLEGERANLWTALNWCGAETDGAKAGLRLTGALAKFWQMRGHYSEGRAALSEALGRTGANERTKERAKALNGAGVLAYYQGDYQAAHTLLEESLALFREMADPQGVAWSLNDLGDMFGAQGDRDKARSLYEESLAIFRELGDRHGTASLLHHLGNAAGQQGDYGKARILYAECVAIFKEMGNRQNVAWSLHRLGNVAGQQGDTIAAWSLHEESLAVFRELGNGQGIAWTLNEMGDVSAQQGNRDKARSLHEESLTIFRKLGGQHGTAVQLQHLGRLAQEEGDSDTARLYCEESLILFRELGNRQGTGWSLNGLGRIALEQNRIESAQALHVEALWILQELPDHRGVAESLEGLAAVVQNQGLMRQAIQIRGAAAALRDRAGVTLSHDERDKFEENLRQSRLALGETSFAEAWEEGRALTWEQAAELAAAKGGTERPANFS